MPWAKEPGLDGARFMTRDSELRWQAGSEFHFAVVERGSDLVLGVVGVDGQGDGAAELHYWIRSDHAGRGLTTEAAEAVIAWSRRVLHLERLTLWAGRDNHASRRVAEKLGFRHVGPLDWEPDGGVGTFPAESYELTL
jgi:RimJ/RimL family protein N-acetyltransferase